MNNIIETHLLDDIFIKLCNDLAIIGYKVCFINFGWSIYDIDINSNIHIETFDDETTLIKNEKILIELLTEEKFDYIFVGNFSKILSKTFNKIPYSEIFYEGYYMAEHDEAYSDYNIINFSKMSYDSFMLKYNRDQKLKSLLKNNE
jgi:hypothetical protein